MEFNKAYNRQEFTQFLQNSFLPEDFRPTVEPVTFSTQMKYSCEAVKLGTSETLDLVVYEIKHTSQHDARVALSKEAFRMLADEMQDRALVIFVPKDNCDNYRFSFIEITLDIAEGTSRVSRNYSNPRRYSYFLGKDIAYYTPNKYLNDRGRVVDNEDLHSRFSVEVLTKEFYNELSDWYAWAIQIIRFPNDINDDTDDAKYNNESAIRLITRLIFVWFLKQRHLIPDQFFDEKFIANNLIEGFNPHAKVDLFSKSHESKYYKAILQNLFFAMLNSPITAEGSNKVSERHFRNGRGDYDNNKLMRYEDYFTNPKLFIDLANQNVPFLNGGLFDCLDDKDNSMYYDGFSDRESIRKSLILPDYLFFGDEVGKNIDLSEWYGDKKKKKVSARGIIDILKRYNFTVEENTPFDQEVSLDPELLGKVFENLLAAYNPETQTTARKQTGSFYTPREIVQYMVDESLIAHLKRTVGKELEPQFRQLLQYSDAPVDFSNEQRNAIMQSLYNCKILDPACGSGAFPMGMLQQMVHILGRIDPDNVQWKEMMMNQAIDETTEAFKSATKEERQEQIADIERSFDEGVNRPDYARKLYLIENCIYGVDIQPIAIQISKLRFFISLVVDQNTNSDPIDNFGIRPLPNLEAKFVAANTLIGLNKKNADLFDSEDIKAKENELKIVKHKIFASKYKTKRKYRQVVFNMRLEIAGMLKKCGAVGNVEAQQLASWDMFDQNASSPFFDPEWMFDIKNGFDIVIGNPPYGAKLPETQKNYLKEKYANLVERIRNSYLYFMGKANELSPDGIISYIVPNEFLFQIYMSRARQFFLSKTHILQVINIGESAFDAVVPTCIFILNHEISHDYIKLADLRSLDIINSDFCFDSISFIQMSNHAIIKNPLHTFSFDYNKNTLLNKLLDLGGRLEDYCLNIFNGISTSCNDVYLIEPNQLEQFNFERKVVRPTLKGEHIQKFYIPNEAPLYILYIDSKFVFSDSPNVSKYLELHKNTLIAKSVEKRNGNRNWYELFRARKEKELACIPKIIIRQTSDCIIAAIDTKGYYSIDSTNILIINPVYYPSINYLLAILNSKLADFYYKEVSQENGRVLAQVKPIRIKNIPMPNIDNQSIRPIMKIVDRIIEAKSINPTIDTTVDEQKIDRLVYNLYGLTYDEVKIVDPYTPITKDEYLKNIE